MSRLALTAWELRCGDGPWLAATAPCTAASALRAAGAWSWDAERSFDAEEWSFRTAFVAERGPHVLGFDGLATLCEVSLDGAPILTSNNMFRAHQVPVDLSAGRHELLLRFRPLEAELRAKRPRPRWRVPMLEHQQLRWFRTTLLGRTPGWSPPCAPVGPWRPVWLARSATSTTLRAHLAVSEAARSPATAPSSSDIAGPTPADIAGADGVVEIRTTLPATRAIIERIDSPVDRGIDVPPMHGVPVPAASASASASAPAAPAPAPATSAPVVSGVATVRVPTPALWWPHTHGAPTLYRVRLETADGLVDVGTVGFRTIDVDQSGGDFAVRVNGVRVFCRGACWTPIDPVSLSHTAAQVHDAIAQVRAAGMNMLRVGGTMVYEDDAFLAELDAQGVLLWQDLMFANMDYPDDATFVANAVAEVEEQLARLGAHACLAIVCGNSEGEQQAAMAGAERARWSPPLFHDVFAERAAAIGAPYVPSSTHGGAFPHAANAGPASYYGVGAYLRPLEDARRAEVRFASECLAFANIPTEHGLPGGPALRVHHALWRRRAPRDLGAGWDFDDVRDHYVRLLHGVDPASLRYADHDHYLALGRVTSGDVMAQTFGEWRRARSVTRGGLIWFLRDLWPGAGWGVIDASGSPKPAYFALARALQPVALAITDEGNNGLVLHAVNDHSEPLNATISVALWRSGEIGVGTGSAPVGIPAHGAIEVAASALFDGFMDLSYAYRFGPPQATLVHATLSVGDARLAEAFAFPAGYPARERDVGLAAAGAAFSVTLTTRRFAESVALDVPGYAPSDNYFHLAPSQSRTIALRALPGRRPGVARGSATALNAELTARFEIPEPTTGAP